MKKRSVTRNLKHAGQRDKSHEIDRLRWLCCGMARTLHAKSRALVESPAGIGHYAREANETATITSHAADPLLRSIIEPRAEVHAFMNA